MASQPPPHRVLRKAPAPTSPAAPPAAAGVASRKQHASAEVQLSEEGAQASEPYTLLDAGSWQVLPASVADALSSSNADFTVVGALGPQGLGKSALLNRLLGFAGPLAAAGPHPTPAFPVCAAAAAGRHCTRGVGLRVSSDRVIGLDTQPLFSASVLEDVATGWSQPPPALAAPALAAAGDAKAAAVPFEGAQALMQLQLAALLLSTCERVLVLCDGWEDRRTWELLATAEMLCRGIPDPSLPPPSPQPAAAGAGGAQAQGAAAAGAQQPRQAPPQEHLAEVVLVHVLPAGQSQEPTTAQLQRLERQLDAFFASSRLRRPGALRMLDHLEGGSGTGSGSSGSAGMSYWVLPALPPAAAATGGDDGPEEAAWAALVAALLARPCPPFARRCSEQQWLRGAAVEVWRAVRKSPDIATFYSRVARTQLKGAGGWALAR